MKNYKKTFLKITFIGILSSASSGNNENLSRQTSSIKNKANGSILNKIKQKHSHFSHQELYYYSTANNQKFDHRVKGLDENGKNVNGIINLEDEIAIGILKGTDNNEIEIVSDQINADKIIATDINGYEYRLKID